MRLVENTDKTLQLFLERIYSTNPHEKIDELILSVAKDKAKHMGVKLYAHGKTGAAEGATVILEGKKSRAPFIYSDAGGGDISSATYFMRGRPIV